MNECLTKPLVFKEVSGCLVEKPECEYFLKLGFSIVCRHPDHEKFQAHATGSLTKKEINARYDTLREIRRHHFIENLDEESRNFLSHKCDFHGRPLTNDSTPEKYLSSKFNTAG